MRRAPRYKSVTAHTHISPSSDSTGNQEPAVTVGEVASTRHATANAVRRRRPDAPRSHGHARPLPVPAVKAGTRTGQHGHVPGHRGSSSSHDKHACCEARATWHPMSWMHALRRAQTHSMIVSPAQALGSCAAEPMPTFTSQPSPPQSPSHGRQHARRPGCVANRLRYARMICIVKVIVMIGSSHARSAGRVPPASSRSLELPQAPRKAEAGRRARKELAAPTRLSRGARRPRASHSRSGLGEGGPPAFLIAIEVSGRVARARGAPTRGAALAAPLLLHALAVEVALLAEGGGGGGSGHVVVVEQCLVYAGRFGDAADAAARRLDILERAVLLQQPDAGFARAVGRGELVRRARARICQVCAQCGAFSAVDSGRGPGSCLGSVGWREWDSSATQKAREGHPKAMGGSHLAGRDAAVPSLPSLAQAGPARAVRG